jgi:type I restriction enzyme S subunit
MIKNWCIVRLGDIAKKITKGGTPTTYGFSFQSKGINFLKVENIQNGSINLKSITDFISEEAHQFQLKSQLSCGDILFSIAGTIGVTTIVESKHIPANTNQALAIIKGTSDTLISKFLLWQLEYFVQKVKSKARGGAMNNVSLEDLKNLNVYVPPLAEQQRIVAKIEELFSELDKGIESLKTAQQQLKVYRQAVLKYAFEGKLTNPDVKEGELPEGWEEKILSEVCEITSSKRIFKDEYVSYGIPFYRTKEVKELSEGKKPAIELYIEKSKYDEIKSRFQVPGKGDVLLSAVGTIGVSYVIRDEKPFYFKDGNLMWFRNLRNIDSYFLSYALTHFIRNGKDASVSGSAYNALTIETMKVFKVAIPELKEQQLVVQEIESRLSVCDKIEESIEQGLQQAEALRQSILKKAFEGKLVPQNPNDEPASVLLERIRAERAAAQPEKKTKTKKVKA